MDRAVKPPFGAGMRLSDNARGILFLCAGLFVFSFQDVIIKLLSDDYPVHEIVFIRGLLATPILMVMVHFDSGFETLRPSRPWLHLARSLCMFCSYMFFYLAVAAIPITTAISLFFTAPLLITALAVPLLGETVGLRRWLGVFVGFVGVIIMTRPGFGSVDPAAGFAVLSAASYAIAQILARRMGITESASVMAFYSMVTFTYLGAGLAFLIHVADFGASEHASLDFLLKPWRMPGGIELAMLATIGVISAMGFFLLTQAYRVGTANAVAPFEYSSMLWATVLTFAVFGSVPDIYTITGAALIFAGGVYVLKRESVKRKKPLAAKGPYRSR